MKISQVVKRLKMTRKPELQEQLVHEAWETCENFFVGLMMSVDKTTIIPLTKIPEIPEDDGAEADFTFEEFQHLYDMITQVGMTPEAARVKVIDAAMRADVTEWNTFYRRILLKKLQDDMPMDIIAKVLQKLTGFQFVL